MQVIHKRQTKIQRCGETPSALRCFPYSISSLLGLPSWLMAQAVKNLNTCKSMADSCQCMTRPLQYCKVISLQLIKINGKKKKKNLPAMQETRVRFLGQEDPLEKKWQPTPVFLPGESLGQRSLAGYSPRGHKSQTRLSNLTTSTAKRLKTPC